MFRVTFYIAVLVILASCNVTRVVKPLEKGEERVSASLGGPGITFRGAPLPIPLSSLTYQRGLDTTVTFSASLHTTSALFGVFQTDLGLGIKTYESKSERFGVTITPILNAMYDIHENNLRLYPHLDAISWWQYSEKPHLLYGGLGTWVELQKAKAHLQVQDNELMPFVTLGHQFVGEKWDFQLEFKYIGFQHDNDPVVVDYISPTGNGAFGIYFGVGRRLFR